MSVKQQLEDLQHGDISDAFEAAQELSSRSRPPVDDLIAILNESKNAHNREAAAYALSWVLGRRNQRPLDSAFPKLEELANTDSEICPNWWRVSEKAADAIEWIHGRETASRLPMSRGSKTQVL